MTIIVSATAFAQQKNPADSIRYYEKKMSQIRRELYDSLNRNSEYKAYRQSAERLRNSSDNYGAFMLYVNSASVDFNRFNADNRSSGFPAVSGQAYSVGYGFSSKKGRRVFDCNLSAFGLSKTTKKSNEEIKANFSTFLQLEWGYDFIKSNKVNIYPYAGLGLRSSSIQYKGQKQSNPVFTNASNVVLQNTDVNESISEFGYQAGVGFEMVLSKKQDAGGTILFIKAGTNRAFSKKTFSLEGQPYNPAFNYGSWVITAGFKFFGR